MTRAGRDVIADGDDAAQEVCGETYDHDTRTTFEDETGYQWECRRCGAEGWEDADE